MISTVALTELSCLSVDKQEVCRYLGVGSADQATECLIEECEKAAFAAAVPKAVYVETDITVSDDVIDFGFMRVQSHNLATNLKECYKAYLFCATLGIGMDRWFERQMRVSPAKATVFSAVGSSLIESFCDYVNKKIVGEEKSRPRFSCGYGDFCLEHQKDILRVLEADKRLGVCLTQSCMMVPVKTVTAVIGIRR